MSRQQSDRMASPDRHMSPTRPLRPLSPDGFGNGLYSSLALGQGLEGLIGASPSAIREARERLEKLASESDGDTSPDNRFRYFQQPIDSHFTYIAEDTCSESGGAVSASVELHSALLAFSLTPPPLPSGGGGGGSIPPPPSSPQPPGPAKHEALECCESLLPNAIGPSA